MKRIRQSCLIFIALWIGLSFRSQSQVSQSQPQDVSLATIAGTTLRSGTTELLSGTQLELIPAEIGTVSDYDNNLAVLTLLKGRVRTYTAVTDSKGAFVITGVSPGRYRLTANHDGFTRTEYLQRGANDRGAVLEIAPGARLTDLTIEMPAAPTISGSVLDENAMPAAYAGVEAFAIQYFPGGTRRLRLVQTADANDLGEYRLYWLNPGDYILAVNYNGGARHEVFGAVSQTRPNVPLPEVDYPTYYYPGSPDFAAAQVLHLRNSSEIAGIDFRLKHSSLATIRGRVTGLTTIGGRPPAAQIRLAPAMLADGGLSYRYRSDSDGKFEIRGVAPGSYIIDAFGSSALQLEVGSKDVENVVIPMSSLSPIKGRLLLDGNTGQLPLDVSLVIPQLFGTLGRAERISGGIRPDGTFITDGAIPGTFQASFIFLPEGFYLKQVIQGTQDVLLSGIKLDSASSFQVDLILGKNTRVVSGTIVGTDNRRAAGAMVVFVPAEAYRGRADRYRRAVTDAAGQFRLVGLPPGNYTAYAFDEVTGDAFYDADFLRRYAGRGVDVTISDANDSTANPKLILVDRQ